MFTLNPVYIQTPVMIKSAVFFFQISFRCGKTLANAFNIGMVSPWYVLQWWAFMQIKWKGPAVRLYGRGAEHCDRQTQSMLWLAHGWVHHVSQAVRSVLSNERDFVLCGEAGLGGLLKVELFEAVECRGESESWKTNTKMYCKNRNATYRVYWSDKSLL